MTTSVTTAFSTFAFGGYPYYGDYGYGYGYYDDDCWQTERVNVSGHLRLRRVWACDYAEL